MQVEATGVRMRLRVRVRVRVRMRIRVVVRVRGIRAALRLMSSLSDT